MRVLVAADGTGEHQRPALATADELKRKQLSVSILFVTAGRDVAERVFDGTTYAHEALFCGLSSAPGPLNLLAWWTAYRKARRLLIDFEPDVVVGFGGYPTAVAGVAALSGRLGPLVALARWLVACFRRSPELRQGRSLMPFMGPPLVLLEQNAVPGRAVKVLSRLAAQVLVALPEAKSALPKAAEVVVTGNPLPREFESVNGAAANASEFDLEQGRPTLLVLGGSQGARAVNRMILAARPRLSESHPNLQILLVTGDADFEAVLSPRLPCERQAAPSSVRRPAPAECPGTKRPCSTARAWS